MTERSHSFTPLNPHDALKHHEFYNPENRLYFPTTKVLE